jgi:hypothetical protein
VIGVTVLGVCLWASGAGAAEPNWLDAYNVSWNTPGVTSAGSMPLGNGDIGINVWVEAGGDLVFYVSKTDAFDGNHELRKLGRLHVALTPNPFQRDAHNQPRPFRQTLKLRQGEIEIQAGTPGSQVTLHLWVDAKHPVIHVEADGEQPFDMRVTADTWSDVHTIVEGQDDRIVMYSRNTWSIYGKNLANSGLEGLAPQFQDPLFNRTYGMMVKGPDLISRMPDVLETRKPVQKTLVSVYALTRQTDTVEAWLTALDAEIAKADAAGLETAREAHRSWWDAFWERSWIRASGGAQRVDSPGFPGMPESEAVSKGYQLQRFITACAGRGNAPIKFNGSIFTFDCLDIWKLTEPHPADDRAWGGYYWFQNTRHPYYPMLAGGDFEMMAPLFTMYRDALPLARERTRVNFGHGGAAFHETITLWGNYPSGEKWTRFAHWKQYQEKIAMMYKQMELGTPPARYTAEAKEAADVPGWYLGNPHIQYFYSGGLELSAMMLDYYGYTGDKEFAIHSLIPFAKEIIEFYDQHYGRDKNGKLFIFPSQAGESGNHWLVVNPMDVVAGLHSVIRGLLALPTDMTAEGDRAVWKRLQGELPALPKITLADGRTVLLQGQRAGGATEDAKAVAFWGHMNIESYAIFPFRLYGVGKPDLPVAKDTTNNLTQRMGGWNQLPIVEAYAGLDTGVSGWLANQGGGARFPAFWKGPFDWIPDQCQGGVGMKALQAKLLQAEGAAEGGAIYLFPAWPRDWDVAFKLHAPYNTTVEGIYRNGKLESLIVTPPARAKDVVNMLEKPAV